MKHILEYNEFFEKITIDVGVGDIIYQGKFKNKKTVIKEIGEDREGVVPLGIEPRIRD